MKTKPLMYLVGALFLIALIGLYVNPQAISGFQDMPTSKLVLVYANWCPHCQTIKPEMETLAKAIAGGQVPELKGKSVSFEMLEESANKAEIAKLPPVKGFPTFFFMKNGNVTEYKGGRDRNSVVSYLSTQ